MQHIEHAMVIVTSDPAAVHTALELEGTVQFIGEPWDVEVSNDHDTDAAISARRTADTKRWTVTLVMNGEEHAIDVVTENSFEADVFMHVLIGRAGGDAYGEVTG